MRPTRPGRRRRRVKREPAIPLEPHLDPRVRVMVGEHPRAGRAVVGRPGEADGDASRNSEISEHERHRPGEVLAVPAPRRRSEAARARARDVRVVRIREPAVDEEPALEVDDGGVRRLRSARDALGKAREPA